MAIAKKHTALVEQVRSYLDGVGKYLTDKLYGPDGPAWGTKLSEIEAVLVEVRDVVTENVLAEALARQAASHGRRPPAYGCCPGCQGPIACPDSNPRVVTTDAGEAEWSEPQGFCGRCRLSFFPSEPESGDRPE